MSDIRWMALPAAAAIASHATALGAGFVWLDHAHLEARLAIAAPSGWLALFTQGFAGTGFYRPLVALSLSIDALAGAPWIFHATNLAWHAAAACAVVLAASELGLEKRAATLAGVLFAVHPATSLVANAIAFRSEAMIATALLVLIAAHVRGRPALAAGAMLAGALTKETALVLGPLFVLALEVSRAAPRERIDPARRRLFLAEGGALALAIALRVAFAPPWRAETPSLSLGEAVGTRLAAISRTAELVVLPVDRTVCDSFPISSWTSPRALAGGLLVALLVWLAWRSRGIALLLALAALPVAQIVPVMRWWSPHYVYVALAFVAIAAAQIISRAPDRRRLVAAAAAAVLFGAVSLVDGRRYATDASLWTPEVTARPSCREGSFYLGEVARAGRRFSEARARYRAAVADWPGVLAYVDLSAALTNLAMTELELGDFAEADRTLLRALDVTSNPTARRRLVHDRAAIALRAGDNAGCWQLLEPEVAREDAFPESIYIAAKALHALGRDAETRSLIRRLQRMGWTGSAAGTGPPP